MKRMALIVVPLALVLTAPAQERRSPPPPARGAAPLLVKPKQEAKQAGAAVKAKQAQEAKETKQVPLLEAIPILRNRLQLKQGIQIELKPRVQIRLGPKLRRNVMEWVQLGNGQGWIGQPPTPPSPLVKGAYKKALKALDAARKEMATATDIDNAIAALNDATKALMHARSALWNQKDAQGKKTGSKAKTDGKPPR